MNDSEDIQRLLRLKRYESPGEEYFQTFLEEFKDRQRSELLHRSARGLLAERVSMWFSEHSSGRWLIPAGATAAVLSAGLLYFNGAFPGKDSSGIRTLASSEIAPALSAEPESPPKEDEIINLQLPRPGNRVPGTSASALSGARGILPVGVRGTLREL